MHHVVGNVIEVKSRKGEVESSVEIKEEKTIKKKSYADIVIHGESNFRDKRWYDLRTERGHIH